MDETKTIAAILNGESNRYADLVERYHVGLIIHCERIVGERDEAEDIAQRAFIKAYENLQKYDPERSQFSTWLYRIASNLAIDFLRSRKFTVSLEAVQLAAPDAPALYEEERVLETRQAVAALKNPRHRRVIAAYYWEGKSYEEMAKEMEVPVNTIKSWLHRAKEQLKGKLS